jgi:hypothetical protein
MAPAKRARSDFKAPRPKDKHNDANNTTYGDKLSKKRGRPSGTGTSKSKSTAKATVRREQESEASDDEEEEQLDAESSDGDYASEAEYVLAELTEDSATSKENVLPLPLIHRVMQDHFQKGEKTKMTTDAREIVGKYIEVFTREAIMRSAYERTERDKQNGATGSSSGWLEVEDLERIAPQLCLDF